MVAPRFTQFCEPKFSVASRPGVEYTVTSTNLLHSVSTWASTVSPSEYVNLPTGRHIDEWDSHWNKASPSTLMECVLCAARNAATGRAELIFEYVDPPSNPWELRNMHLDDIRDRAAMFNQPPELFLLPRSMNMCCCRKSRYGKMSVPMPRLISKPNGAVVAFLIANAMNAEFTDFMAWISLVGDVNG